MNNQIFCSNSHLVLTAAQCNECDWVRPREVLQGKLKWEPVELGVELAGSIKSNQVRVEGSNNIIPIPSKDGIILGIRGSDGGKVWESPLPVGFRTNRITVKADQFYFSASDIRELGSSEGGFLAAMDPITGSITELWKFSDSGHHITHPIVGDGFVLIRTSEPALVCLNTSNPFTLRWKIKLERWFPQEPTIIGNQVILSDSPLNSDSGKIKALSLDQGCLVWEYSTARFVSDCIIPYQDKLIFSESQKKLKCIQLETRDTVWEYKGSFFYTAPMIEGNMLYLAVRGSEDAQAANRYQMAALSANDGHLIWEKVLNDKVSHPIFYSSNQLIAITDNSLVLSHQPDTGDLLWSCKVSEEEKPMRLQMFEHGGSLFTGTWDGTIAAVKIVEDTPQNTPPDILLQNSLFEEAAIGFALTGNYSKAAEIYQENLNDPEKALLLFAAERNWEGAARAAEKVQNWSKALEFYTVSHDLQSAGRINAAMGDQLAAARCYEEAGDIAKAAQAYLAGNELRKAIYCFKQIGDFEQANLIAKTVPPEHQDIDLLEAEGNYKEAGDIAMRLGEYNKAVMDYEKAGDGERSLLFDALKKLVEVTPEAWGFEKLAAVSRRLARFQEELYAWEWLKKTRECAEACDRVILQLEANEPGNRKLLADYCKKAYQYFKELAKYKTANSFKQKWQEYGEIPEVSIIIKPKEQFIEGRWNALTVIAMNQGRGLARDIEVYFECQQFFESVDNEYNLLFPPICDEPVERCIELRPIEGKNILGSVPLRLVWKWCDTAGTCYEGSEKGSSSIHVKSPDEDKMSDTSVKEIHYHIDQQVNITDGEYVTSGDVYKGNAQNIKDLSASVTRNVISESGIPTHTDKYIKYQRENKCPQCGIPIPTGEMECPYCHLELSNKKGNKKN